MKRRIKRKKKKKTDSHLFYYAYEIYNGSYVDVMLAAP